MNIYEDLASVSSGETGYVVAVGNFDGVHLGHQAIFRETAALAAEKSARGLVLTFSAHPVSTLKPDKTPGIVMALEDRLHFASRLGIEAALVLPFDRETADLTAEEFVHRILVSTLGARAVVSGKNWRFGKNRTGDLKLLGGLGKIHGFSVSGIPPVLLDGAPVSSTRVRGNLAQGEVELAGKLLGRPHFVRGSVIPGAGRGRNLGFPTINLDCGKTVLPARGVYSGAFFYDGVTGAAAVNVGTRPTFGPGQQVLEAHLIGVKEDLYDRQVTVSFLKRLRDELPFTDENSLISQISEDVKNADLIFRALAADEALL